MLTISQFRSHTARHRTPDSRLALYEIGRTIVPLFGLLWIGALLIPLHVGAGILCGVLASPFFVRTFVLAHDATHGTLFPSPRANRIVGRMLATIALTPFTAWRLSHLYHHAHTGDLGAERGRGAMHIMTYEEYHNASMKVRWGYRMLYHPIVLFGILAPLLFHVFYRIPMGSREEQRSILATNFALLLCSGALCGLTSPQILWYVILPATTGGSIIGVWLFFVQHCHHDAKYLHHPQPGGLEVALGASHYELPRWINVLTLWIGHHTLHHIDPQIPSYRLEEAWHSTAMLLPHIPRLSLGASMRTPSRILWDENNNRLIRP